VSARAPVPGVNLLGRLHGVIVTPVGLEFPGDLPFERWQGIGERLGRAHDRIQWFIGDWWNYGVPRYGHRQQAAEEWGIPLQTCDNYASVARRFPHYRRRENLPFSHHAEVAFLPEHEADQLLDWCAAGRVVRGHPWSIRALRQEKYRREQAKIPPAATRRIGLRIEPRSEPPHVVPLRSWRNPGLDDSPGGGPVAPELAALQEEPLPAPDRVAMAKAALRALSNPDFDVVIEECIAERYGPASTHG